MVKIAVAGGSGEVAREVIDVLAATNKHQITILSRKEPTTQDSDWHAVTWRRVNHEDKDGLVGVLRGVHTVLSFVQLLHDPENKAQKTLIDAAVLAGVKRFAPSEWGSRTAEMMPWWAGKDEIKEYLDRVNENEKVLEYCLFQPGLFLNYLASPHKTSQYLTPLNTFVDFHHRRAIIVDGHDPVMTFTTVQDLAAVVAQAVEFDGEWPMVGGIRGNRLAVSKILEIGQRVRGGSFTVDSVQMEDLEAGKLTASWTLGVSHPSVSEEEATRMMKSVLVGMLLSSAQGAWEVSDEWNQLLPDHKFTDIEEFLEKNDERRASVFGTELLWYFWYSIYHHISTGGSQVLFQLTRKAGHAEQLFDRAYVMSPGFVPGAGHHHAEQFWQNSSSAVGCDGGHLACMRKVNFTTLNTAATEAVDGYTYQFQPRVDGDFVADTYESQLYQKRFNFSGPVVITHEQHEANRQAWTGVNTTADVSTYLKIFFPAITDDVVNELLELYPESDYTSPGLRFSDMKQSLDSAAHNLALTQALDNKTWNAEVGLSPATHGTDQNYYWYSTYTLSSSSETSAGTSSGGATGSTNSTTGAPTGSTGSTSSNATSSSDSTESGPSGTTGAGGGESSSVNSTIAITMQKYLLSFILTGNPNTKWPGDKPYWPLHGDNTTHLIFNDTFSIDSDDLANNKSLYWNKALWY